MTLVIPTLTSYPALASLPDDQPVFPEWTRESYQSPDVGTTGSGERVVPKSQSTGRSSPRPTLLSAHHVSNNKMINNNNKITSSPLPPPSSPCPRTTLTAHGTTKRRLDLDDSGLFLECRPKRISPFLNTPKQKREERRRVLRISVQKLRQIDDAEIFLRRSVLINNTMKKLQQEVRDEKMARFGYHRRKDEEFNLSCNPRRRSDYEDVLNNGYLSCNPLLFDDIPSQFNNNDKITEDMTDSIVKNIRGMEEDENTSDAVHSPANAPSSTTDKSSQTESSSFFKNSDMDTSDTQTTRMPECGKDACNADNTSNITERDRQILGEMDIVFNNLIRVLSESG